jgi:hypothetical protein
MVRYSEVMSLNPVFVISPGSYFPTLRIGALRTVPSQERRLCFRLLAM